MMDNSLWENKPMAAAPWISYRYKGRFSYIMIGAMSTEEALSEANRSLENPNSTVDNLEIYDYNECKYTKV